MDELKNLTGVLNSMAENEELVSDLYRKYSEKFTEHKDFWLGLSVEEIDHSKWIHELRLKVRDGSVRFNGKRFNGYAIENFRDYMNELIGIADAGEVTLESALSTALDIESALIERKFFEVFESDADELKEVLTLLSVSTKKHAERVREQWNKIKIH